MCGTFLREERRRARKDHRCAACRVPIPTGHTYVLVASVDDGRASSAKWHQECWDEFQEMLRVEGEDCGDPWLTWEDGMPAEIKQRYMQGPIYQGDAK